MKMGAERASELTLELVDRLINPIKIALDEAFEAAEANWGAEVSAWPSWSATNIATELLPPKSERTLIDSTDWHGLFDAMLAESFPDDLAGDLRAALRVTISKGSFKPAPEGSAQCIELISNWMPALPVFAGNRTPTHLQLSINFSQNSVEDRARQWMERSATPFGNFLNASLRSYLGEEGAFEDSVSPAELKKRQSSFLAKLRAVIDAADPLVHIDTNLYKSVHCPPTEITTARHFSRIPLGAHELTDKVETLLLAVGVKAENMPEMVSDNNLKGIDVTTTLGAPHNLLTIKSLMEPIGKQWSAATTGGNNGFWNMRRTKPLREFIPASQALIHCLVRGWYTARLLGRIDTETQPVEIFCANRGPAQFPKTELSPHFAGKADMMARILESLSIAYVECNSNGNLEPLRAYIELRNLGASFPGTNNTSLYSYDTLNPELEKWLNTGKVETGESWGVSPMGTTEMPGSSIEAKLTRAAVLRKALDTDRKATENSHKDLVTKSNEFPNTLTHTKLWRGIFEILVLECAKLSAAIGTYELSLKADEAQGGGSLMGG